jgi:uncharacterized protein (DUF2141 family)
VVRTGFFGMRWIVLLATGLLSTTSLADGKLTIEFEGLASDSGRIATRLLDSPEQFLSRVHKPRHSTLVYITSGKATWVIENLVFGKYVVSSFHDANTNGDIDTGLFGIPTEDYGFSNNARGIFGPPDYEDAEFEFNQSEQTLIIQIH